MENMQDDAAGENLTESFEGCKLKAYWDPDGVCWTIGWGHTGPEVVEGLVWTQAQANAALEADRAIALACVNRCVTVKLSQPEFDALVDFTYNLGCARFQNSTLLKLLNAGDYSGAAAQFDLWDHAGGKIMAGLLRRRQSETDLFESGMDTASGIQA